MLKVNSYSVNGSKLTATVSLPKEWEEKMNLAILSQAIHVYRDRLHFGFAKSKTRGEVNRTTKKWYKQKGTGGARHGARSAPIFVGGGTAHGPTGLKRELTMPQQMRRKALYVSLTAKVKEGKVFVGDVSFKKTTEAQEFVTKVFGKKDPRVTFILSKENLGANKYLRNIKNVNVIFYPNLNAHDIFLAGNVVFDKDVFEKEKETKK